MKQKLKGGGEYDVIGGGRHQYCYTRRAGTCAKIKRKARRRLRQEARSDLCVLAGDVTVGNWDHWRDDESCDPFEGTSIREEREDCI